jgi:hypothetical protein
MSMEARETKERWMPLAGCATVALTPCKREKFSRFRECISEEEFDSRMQNLATSAEIGELHSFFFQFELDVFGEQFPVNSTRRLCVKGTPGQSSEGVRISASCLEQHPCQQQRWRKRWEFAHLALERKAVCQMA